MSCLCDRGNQPKGKVSKKEGEGGQDSTRPKLMLAAVHGPPTGNQDQLNLLLIDNWPHVSPCGSIEVALKGEMSERKILK